MIVSVYNIYSSVRLHDFYLGIPKSLKGCTFKYHGSNSMLANFGGEVESSRPLSRMRMQILRGVNSLLMAIKGDTDVSWLHVYFFRRGCSFQLNLVFCNSGTRVMPDCNDSRSVDTVSSILSVYIDRKAWFEGNPELTEVNAMYTVWKNQVTSYNYGPR